MENNMMNHQNLTAMNFLSPQHLFAEESPIKAITKGPRGSHMTIFYNGQVIVFDDVPAEKAKEVMFFANKGTSQRQVTSTPVVYDLPMTRKASLHRFLEKRKDRIAARAPYQKRSPMGNLDKPIEESMAWLALAPQSPQDRSESSSSSVLF